MARGNINILKTLSNASFLLVVILGFIFLYAYSFTDNSIIFGNLSGYFYKIYTVYAVAFSLSLTAISIFNPGVLKRLAQANFWKAFMFSFIPSAIFTAVLLIFLKVLLKGTDSINIFTAIASLNPGIVLTHLAIVTQMEELMFGALIFPAIEEKTNKRNANIVTIILFPLWHLAKTGGNFMLTIFYAPLRAWWNYIRNNGTPVANKIQFIGKYFAPTPITQQGNAGAHFGWNLFIIGFVEPFRI